jgi:D-galactarolactone cycloisomerase
MTAPSNTAVAGEDVDGRDRPGHDEYQLKHLILDGPNAPEAREMNHPVDEREQEPNPDLGFRIARVFCYVFRVPIETPVVTSFGVMKDRPALFLRVVASDSSEGWGEVWCNFPAVGAEHRARLVETVLAPVVTGQDFENPAAASSRMSAATEILAIQSGEPGPLSQAIAGLDIAIWDMLARRAGQPLFRFLGAAERQRVAVYASGLNADRPEILARQKFAEGYRRFKVKVGFGRDIDLRNLREMRELFGPRTEIMVDANQAWSFDVACEMSHAFASHAPSWLEEPMRADVPVSVWAAFAKATSVSVANGENLRGISAFRQMVEHGGIRFVQPDIGKWGGFSGCLEVGRHALEHDVTVCPHWLGGGIGLVASLHFLAAVGGPGLLEVDANPNPLRDRFIRDFPEVAEGDMLIPQGIGLGVAPDLQALERYRIDV